VLDDFSFDVLLIWLLRSGVRNVSYGEWSPDGVEPVLSLGVGTFNTAKIELLNDFVSKQRDLTLSMLWFQQNRPSAIDIMVSAFVPKYRLHCRAFKCRDISTLSARSTNSCLCQSPKKF
jgi:hypothetical protein